MIYNYPPKGRWIVVDIYLDSSPTLRGKVVLVFTKSISSSELLAKRRAIFSLRSQNSEYPRIFLVTGANQNVRKLLSTDLVNTKY